MPKHDQYQFVFVLPKFPVVDENTKLLDLITSESWQFFDILNLPGDWLALPPAEWKENPDYLAAAELVKTVKVINDVAERGVKIASVMPTFSPETVISDRRSSRLWRKIDWTILISPRRH